MKKLLIILTTLYLTLSCGICNVYADEMPEMPDTEGMTAEEANELIEKYNEEVDAYNEQLEITYQEELEAAMAHNEAEDEKVAENEAQLEAYAPTQQKIDKHEEKGITETRTDDPEDLPTDWTVTTEASEAKTIKVEEAEEKSGQTVRIINVHIFYAEDADHSTFSINELSDLEDDDNIQNHLALAEWEAIEVDQNDYVTVISEAESMGYKSAAFYKWFEGYTNGYWMPSGTVFTSNAAYSYSDWYKGVAQNVSYAYGTTDRREAADVFSLYTYDFYRLGAEPQKVEKYTPEYKELPTEPEKLEKMDLLEIEEKEDIVPAIVNDEVKTEENKTVPAVIEETIKAEPERGDRLHSKPVIIAEDDTPLAAPVIEESSWALINLLALIATILVMIGSLIKAVFNKEHRFNSGRILSVIPAPLSLYVFLNTENMNLQMAMTDKWTLLMIGLFLAGVLLVIITRRRKEDDEPVNSVSA
ncbi:MAG: hypothetical protein IJJ00_07765 [Erysipelotrichaceae bacterium]|nr:hypothetical protein [Erysipelotrichaceae bacterium]